MTIIQSINPIKFGSLCLVLCCIIYLAWWSIAFNPTKKFPLLPKCILFALTALSGVIGVVLIINGIGELPVDIEGLSNGIICMLGAVIYALLLVLTSILLHRQVTTELLLIIGWMVMELCVMNSLYRAFAISPTSSIVYSIVIIIAAIVGMICYLVYYKLEAVKAFYDGMVPLALVAIVMAVQILII